MQINLNNKRNESDFDTAGNTSSEPLTEQQWVSGVYDWCGAAVFSLTIVVLVFAFLFRIVGVDGKSMQPTLQNHDRLIITNMFYTPRQGDIVIINRYDDKPLVKRVIAVAGDRVQIDEDTHQVFVNGEVVQEDYIQGLTYPGIWNSEQTVPHDCLFVMGDNREHSRDSREFGYFSLKDIMGKAIFRFLPLSTAGGLY